METVSLFVVPKERQKSPVLKQVFDWYADESITDEQIQRILVQVIQMIDEGVFDKPQRRRDSWLTRPVTSVIANIRLLLQTHLQRSA